MSKTDLPSLPEIPAGASDVRAPAFPLAPGSAARCPKCNGVGYYGRPLNARPPVSRHRLAGPRFRGGASVGRTTKLTPLPPTATVDGTENFMTKSKAKNRKRPAAVAGAARGSASALTFKKLFADVKRRQRERIRKAGKHECVKAPCGTLSRVTGRGDKILKRPIVAMRFYECKICGRDMTPNNLDETRPRAKDGC